MPISNSPSSSSFFDTLLNCQEEQEEEYNDHDFLWEDEELVSLFTKQQLQSPPFTFSFLQTNPSLLLARKQAVDWILKVKSHFGFAHLTAILAINYLDRFISSLLFHKDNNKPWMIQLVAVTCLSLAAKIEQTQVPSLLDLQVEETKYLFEAKTIQRMELLVMSTLKWKMNPVTPISFLDHIVRRFGLKKWEYFFKKCEDIILSMVSDSRFVGYEASVMATATMVHVIEEVDFFNSVEYQNQLLDVLKTTKEKVKECHEMMMMMMMEESSHACSTKPKKRKLEEDDDTMNSNRVAPMDAHLGSSLSSSTSSSHHNHHQPPNKKMQQQKLGFTSISCITFVDVTSSSPR